MLERFNDEIQVEHKKEDSKEKRNKKRKEAIENNIDENLEIDKPTFQRFIKRKYIGEKKDQMLVKTKNINENIKTDKTKFKSFIKKNYKGEKKNQKLKKTKNIDFSKASTRNNTFMNELAFAGESISEGFLECFNIERKKAVENYKNQL